MMEIDKKNIIRNFSRSAYLYDRYADVQKKTALELAGRLRPRSFDNILEIGCGTGNYALLLTEKFKRARLKAIDISEKMIEVAQNKLKDREVEFVVADAEDVDLDENFDLITSNACFQWFGDLEKTLIRYKNMLRRNGLISFSLFGPATFGELNASLKRLFKDACVSATRFIDEGRLKIILEAHFKEVRIEEVMYAEEFSCLSDLLKKIRHTGTNTTFNARPPLRPRQLELLEAAYLKRFKKIKATYQVFFCQGSKI